MARDLLGQRRRMLRTMSGPDEDRPGHDRRSDDHSRGGSASRDHRRLPRREGCRDCASRRGAASTGTVSGTLRSQRQWPLTRRLALHRRGRDSARERPGFRPDLAGWRRERLATLPAELPVLVRPDWVCEVLSTNRQNDLVKGQRAYHRNEVGNYWILDPIAKLSPSIAGIPPASSKYRSPIATSGFKPSRSTRLKSLSGCCSATTTEPAPSRRSGRHALFGDEPNLVGYFRFDEGAGLPTQGASASKHHTQLGEGNAERAPTWAVPTLPSTERRTHDSMS